MSNVVVCEANGGKCYLASKSATLLNGNGTDIVCFDLIADLSSDMMTCSCGVLKKSHGKFRLATTLASKLSFQGRGSSVSKAS